MVIITAAANALEIKAAGETLDGIVTERPRPSKYRRREQQQHLCALTREGVRLFRDIELLGFFKTRYNSYIHHIEEIEKRLHKRRPLIVVEGSIPGITGFQS